jgi:hypothetical protein
MNEHLLDTLIQNYYRIQEINKRPPVLIEYDIEEKGQSFYLTLRINRTVVGGFNFMSIDACKSAVIESYFIKGIEDKITERSL